MKSRVQAVTFGLCAAFVFSALVSVPAFADSAPIPGMQSSSDNGTGFLQGQAPLPGAPTNSTFFQNLNEKTSAQAKAPVQTKQVPQKQIQASKNPATAPGGYSLLPITVDQAQARIAELKEKLETNPPNTMQESIYVTCEWMQELANSHWKMYQVFDKNDSTKAQAKEEKALALEFSKLKNKAKLLKADLLIKQQRVPEAIDPLVEIVVAEPTSSAGQEAYKRLVDLGFSKNVASVSNAI